MVSKSALQMLKSGINFIYFLGVGVREASDVSLISWTGGLACSCEELSANFCDSDRDSAEITSLNISGFCLPPWEARSELLCEIILKSLAISPKLAFEPLEDKDWCLSLGGLPCSGSTR